MVDNCTVVHFEHNNLAVQLLSLCKIEHALIDESITRKTLHMAIRQNRRKSFPSPLPPPPLRPHQQHLAKLLIYSSRWSSSIPSNAESFSNALVMFNCNYKGIGYFLACAAAMPSVSIPSCLKLQVCQLIDRSHFFLPFAFRSLCSFLLWTNHLPMENPYREKMVRTLVHLELSLWVEPLHENRELSPANSFSRNRRSNALPAVLLSVWWPEKKWRISKIG